MSRLATPIRKNDNVLVITGKNRGTRGRVLRVDPDKNRLVVEGVNIIKKHAKANPRQGIKGGIVQREAPVHVAKLMPIDPQTQKATRIGHKFLDAPDGRRIKVRIARVSGVEMDR